MYHPRFSGSHYEMGLKFGRLMSKNHVNLSEIIQLTQEKREFGRKCIAICREVYPEAIQEMEGIAEGTGFSLIDFAGWIFCIYCYEYEHGCTCLALKDENNIIFGRNSDFFVEIKDVCESALYRPEKGYWFIGNSTAMVQMEDGYNEHGLAVGLNYIFPNKIKPGLNAGMLLRYMLEKCKTVKEALEVLPGLPISSTQKLAMIDKSGDMAVVECNDEEIAIIEPAKNGNQFVVSTNHFINAQMKSYQVRFPSFDSIERYDVASRTLSEAHAYSCELVKDILAGRFGFMCQYEKETGFDTIWSTIIDLKSDIMLRAEGNPSKTGFKEDTRMEIIKKKQDFK